MKHLLLCFFVILFTVPAAYSQFAGRDAVAGVIKADTATLNTPAAENSADGTQAAETSAVDAPDEDTTVSIPAVPVAAAPADSATGLDPPVTFRWEPVSDAESYRIRIFEHSESSAGLFVDTLITGQQDRELDSPDTSFTYTGFSHLNTYTWTLNSVNSAGESESTGPYFFSTHIRAPVPVRPQNGAANTGRYPELSWELVDGAGGYLVEVAGDSLFRNITATYETADTNRVTAGPLRWQTRYFWRVYTTDDVDTSRAGRTSAFTTGRPKVSFEPERLHFGMFETGERVQESLTMTNTGSDTLFIRDITLPDRRVILRMPYEYRPDGEAGLPPGEDFTVEVRINTSEPVRVDGHVLFDDRTGAADSVHVWAYIGSGELTISADTLPFQSTYAGEKTIAPVRLKNTGNNILEIRSVTTTDAGDGPGGTFASGLENFRLEPDEVIVDSVTFAPVFDPETDRRPASEGMIVYRDAADNRDTLYLRGNTKPVIPELEHRIITIGRERTTEIHLSAEGSVDPDGGDLTYSWYLVKDDDISRLSDESELLFRPTVGSHRVLLTVTDEQGATNSSMAQLDIVSFIHEMDGAVEAGLSAYGDSTGFRLFITAAESGKENGSKIHVVDQNLEKIRAISVSRTIRNALSITPDSLFFFSGGSLLKGLDHQGMPLWTPKELTALVNVTPALDIRNRHMFAGTSDGTFHAVDYNSGEPVWTFDTDDIPVAAPAVITRDHKLVFPSTDGTIYGFDLNAMTVDNGVRPDWRKELQDSLSLAAAVDDDDYIIVGTSEGRLLRLSLETDGEVLTLWDEMICASITSQPVIDGEGYIYVGCRDGIFYKMDGTNGAVEWAYSTGSTIAATPVISDYGRIYLGNNAGELTALNTEGERIWHFKGEGAFRADLLHIGGVTFAGTTEGRVYGFYDGHAGSAQADWRRPVWGTYMGNNRRTGYAADRDIADGELADHDDDPSEFRMSQNYPNPFNPDTHISYTLPEQVHVRLEVYNMLGQLVSTLVNEQQGPGSYTVRFNGTNAASGMYIFRITAGSYSQTRTMTLIK